MFICPFIQHLGRGDGSQPVIDTNNNFLTTIYNQSISKIDTELENLKIPFNKMCHNRPTLINYKFYLIYCEFSMYWTRPARIHIITQPSNFTKLILFTCAYAQLFL